MTSPTKAIRLAMATLALLANSTTILAKTSSKIDIGKLADQSSVIVQARVERLNSSLDHDRRTALVSIEEVLIGDKTLLRHTATAVLSKGSKLPVGSAVVLFADLKHNGDVTTLVDHGEMTLLEVESSRDAFDAAIADRRDMPIRELIRHASRVFRGKIEQVETTTAGWQIVTVRVASSIYRAETSLIVRVALGPKHSKVKTEQDSVFIVRKPNDDEPNHETVVTDPNGVQPSVLEFRIRDLVKKEIPTL